MNAQFRMQAALRDFANIRSSCSDAIYCGLLGIELGDVQLLGPLPKNFSVPNLPELDQSQVCAVKTAVQQPICLIQVCKC